MSERDPLPDCRDEEWLKVPPHLREGLRRYLVERVRPGRFLSAVISNDLAEAVLRASDNSVGSLPEVVRFLYNHAPSKSHGSADNFEAWLSA